jgi:hypothetical protein
MRRAEVLEIFRRGVAVEMHREQLALDQVGLGRLAQTNGDVGLAYGEMGYLETRNSCMIFETVYDGSVREGECRTSAEVRKDSVQGGKMS